VHLPVFAEPVSLPRLPRVATAIGAVLALDERGVHTMACHRLAEYFLQPFRRAEDLSLFYGHDAIVLAVLVHRRVNYVVSDLALGENPRPARLSSPRGSHRLTEGLLDRRGVGRVLVAGHQFRRITAELLTDLADDCIGVFPRSRPGDHSQDELVLGVERNMIPVVAEVIVIGVRGVAVLLLLVDERPFLIELDFAGIGGKRPPTRRGRLWRAYRPAGPSV
jgi:hypothetical protein